ncbi:MAG: GNAT family N-acetyltransferase [Paludibacteraceae bacterium]|nr:GNAT family N-acetyltransferase [Prevotella sp.]MBQ8706167.1 GNAT family N-acetyltransferase [Paludibacteraceae bacterium]MBQ8713824.1 GNAT family N-acetyltransferase [Prevotella sp.]
MGKIRLRAIEPEDLDLLYTIENDVSLWDVGTTNVPYSRYTLHDYIAHANDDIYSDRQVRLIVENMDGQVVGIADVVNFDPQHLRAELGIVILSEYRHLGYATAAIEDLLRYSLRVLHLHQVFVIVDDQNEIAKNLFNKLAFKESGRLNQWLSDGHTYHDAILMQRFL